MNYYLYVIGLICFSLSLRASDDALLAQPAQPFNSRRLILKKLCNQDFWFMLRALPEDRITGLEKEPFLKHAGYWRLPPANGDRIGLNGCKVPVIDLCLYKETQINTWKNPTRQKWIKGYGEAFVGLTVLEGPWEVVKDWHFNKYCLKKMNAAFPESKEGSYRLVEAYFKKNLLLNDINVPVLPGSIGFMDHHTLRWGARATTTYFGSNLLFAQLQSAFARGAARQFGKLWNAYYATCGLYIKLYLKDFKNGKVKFSVDGGTYFNYPAPEIAERTAGMYRGARFGADVKTTMRPNLFYCYMTGVNTLEFESDSASLRYAGYNPHVPPETPLVRNLREAEIYPSPLVDLLREIDAYAGKQPRGTPYTPFAVLLDRHHGYICPDVSTFFTFAPRRDRSDYQINAVFNELFPFEKSHRNVRLGAKAEFFRDVPAEQSCFINLPYGNIFDVLTNDCSPDILAAYPVVLLTGPQGNWPDVPEKLVDYVKNGGTLVMDISQLRKGIPPEMSGIEAVGRLAAGNAYIDRSQNAVTDRNYSYHQAKLTNTAGLIYDSASRAPLLIRTKYGKGIVLLSTIPFYLSDSTKPEKAGLLKLYRLMLKQLVNEVMPVRVESVSGGIDYSLNKAGKDWLATLINYDGITHNMGQAAVLDKSKTARINLEADGKYNAVDTISGKKPECEYSENKTRLKLTVEPGEIKIIKLSR